MNDAPALAQAQRWGRDENLHPEAKDAGTKKQNSL